MYLVDQVRDGVRAVLAGEQPQEQVYFYGNGYRGGSRRFDWIRSGTDSAVIMLSRDKQVAKEFT